MRLNRYRVWNTKKSRWEWRWRLIHRNGRILAHGGQAYSRLTDLRKVTDHLFPWSIAASARPGSVRTRRARPRGCTCLPRALVRYGHASGCPWRKR